MDIILEFLKGFAGQVSIIGMLFAAFFASLLSEKKIVRELMDVIVSISLVIKKYKHDPDVQKIRFELIELLELLSQRLARRVVGRGLSKKLAGYIAELKK